MSNLWRNAPSTIKAFLLVNVVGFVVGLLDLFTSTDEATEELKNDPSLSEAGISPESADTIAAVGVGVGVVFALLSAALGLFFFYKMLQGRKWAWIVLVVFGAIGVLLSLVGLVQPTVFAIIGLLLAIISLVLLLMKDTKLHVNQPQGIQGSEPPYPTV